MLDPPEPTAPASAVKLPGPAAPAPITRRELLWAALGGLLIIGLFLSPALLTGRVLSPADLLFDYYPWRALRPVDWPGASNPLLSDSALIFEPWLTYARQRVLGGSLPLWNPNNYLGAPFVGNMQSAVFSPLTWLAWLWPGAGMLTWLAALKLGVAAAGTYLLARQALRMGVLGATVGALGFTFGAFMTVWLLYPLASVIIWLPWAWWATARLLAAPSPSRVAALALIAALSLLAGQPETAYQVALATGLFALVAAFALEALRPAVALRRLGLAAGAYLLGGALAAIQLLPFGEYLAQSTVVAGRIAPGAGGVAWPLPFLWTLVSPDLWGNPAHHDWWGGAPNYGETNLYSGLLLLLLAPLALTPRDRYRRRLAIFLLLAAILAVAVANQWPGIYAAVTALPLLSAQANQRFVVFAEFALALLGALGADALIRGDGNRRRLLLAWVPGLLIVLVGGLAVPALFAGSLSHLPAAPGPEMELWQDGLLRAGVIAALGSLLIAALIAWGRRGGRWVPVLAGALPLLLFLDLWQAHGDYNPTVAPADYFPNTAATQFLQAQPGLFRAITAGWMFLPNTNLMYGIPDLAGYDGLEPQSYRDLAVTLDPTVGQTPGGALAPFTAVQSPLINLLNVRYVLVPPGSDPNYVPAIRFDTPNVEPVGAIHGAFRPGQVFVAPADNLTQIQVFGATYQRQPAGHLVLHLKTDPAAPADLATVTLDTAGLADNSYWTFAFPPLRQAKGRTFYFYLESPDAPADQAVTIYYGQALAYPQGRRMQDGQPAGGNLLFRAIVLLDPDNPPFVPVFGGAPADMRVYENRRALPRAWLVHAAEVQPATKALLRRLADPTFDSAATALLAASLPPTDPLPALAPAAGQDTVQVTSYAAEQVEIASSSPAAGLLILADQAFPGWQATVDGRPAPILTADHALRAVYLPAGAHRVRFTYAPDSVKIGAILSGVTLVLIVGLIGSRAWPFRRKQYDSP